MRSDAGSDSRLQVSQTECESARPQLLPDGNPERGLDRGLASIVGSWGHIPAGCSHRVGAALDGAGGAAWESHAPHWNVRPTASQWAPDFWPVCRAPPGGYKGFDTILNYLSWIVQPCTAPHAACGVLCLVAMRIWVLIGACDPML